MDEIATRCHNEDIVFADEEKRVKYEDAPEEEQVARFRKLNDVFKDGSMFREFCFNAPRYADRFKVEDVDGVSSVCSLLSSADAGVDLIGIALDFYLQVNR